MVDDGVPLFNDLTELDVRVKLVDVGANPIDEAPPYSRMLQRGQVEVVGFEPNAEALADLKRRQGPHETYLPHAVGDGRRHLLRRCHAPGMTSLLEPDPAVSALFHYFPIWTNVLDRVEIETVRLDDVPETIGADMIKIDIQGGELMALQGAVGRLRDVLVVQAEVEFLPLYKNQPLFSEVELFLRSQGFMFHRFHPLESRVLQPLTVEGSLMKGLSQAVDADAIFVRSFVSLDSYSDRQLLATAAMVHNFYRSIDLCMRFLYEYDRRTGTNLVDRYFGRLTGRA